MAQNLPYLHPSISELAKALRKSINIAESHDLSQSEMLQLLAKAVGFQNYQSWKASTDANAQEQIAHFIELSCNLHYAGEVFERDADNGHIIDRRHQSVSKILASVTLTISTPRTKASVKCIVSAAAGSFTERQMVAPEKTLALLTMQYIAKNSESFFSSIEMMRQLKIAIPEEIFKSHSRIYETTNGELIVNLAISDQAFQKVVAQSNSVRFAIQKYEASISYLKNIAFSDKKKLIPKEKEIARESLAFIKKAMEISTEVGTMTMYSWNHEKFPSIERFINSLLNDIKFDDSDKASAMRNLSAWRAGEVWIEH